MYSPTILIRYNYSSQEEGYCKLKLLLTLSSYKPHVCKYLLLFSSIRQTGASFFIYFNTNNCIIVYQIDRQLYVAIK